MSARLVAGVLLCLAGAQPTALADDASMLFRTIGLEQGLSQSAVHVSFQDQQGFVWMGTEAGLNRFDGYDVLVHTADPDSPDALPDDYIWDIAETSDGDLWLATDRGGLVRFHRRQNRFEQVFVPQRDGAPVPQVRSVVVDGADRIWIASTRAGIYRVAADGSVLGHWAPGGDEQAELDTNVLAVQADGTVVAGASGDLIRFSPPAYAPQALSLRAGSERIEHSILSLHVADDDTVWVGTDGSGLLRVRSPGAEVTSFRSVPDDATTLPSDRVHGIVSDHEGRLWVATAGGLAMKPAGSGERMMRIQHDPAQARGLAQDYLLSVSSDRNGKLWVGTLSSGVQIWNPISWALGRRGPGWLAGSNVTSFAPTPDGGSWIGTLGAGLSRVDAAGNRLADAAVPAAAIGDQNVMSLARTGDGRIWVGTMSSGLFRLDVERGAVAHFPYQPDRAGGLPERGVMSLLAAGDGKLWVGTFGGGLAVLDSGASDFRVYRADAADPVSIGSNRVTALAEDDRGRIWVGTDGAGLRWLDPESGRFHAVAEVGDTRLPSKVVYSLLALPGEIWVGMSTGGLVVLNLDGEGRPRAARRITQADGLSGNVVYGIRADRLGNVWVSTNSGVSRISTDASGIQNFRVSHGLHSNEFNFGASGVDAEGRVLFGSAGGYNVISPAQLRAGERPAPLRLTAVSVVNRPIEDLEQVLESGLQLTHRDPFLNIELSLLDYSDPEKNSYQFLLEGFDSDWSPPSAQRRAVYTNLDPGRYRLRARARSSDGSISANELSIPIGVLPAPWASMPAIVAYVLAVLACAIWFYRRRIELARREALLTRMAYYDVATGLPNRELFQRQIGDQPVAVLCVHLRRDDAGSVDALAAQHDPLSSYGRRLAGDFETRELPAPVAGLARLDRDLFAVAIRHSGSSVDNDRAHVLAARLKATSESGGGLQELGASVRSAVGIAKAPDHGDSIDELVDHAVLAAQTAQDIPSGICWYSTETSQRQSDRLEMVRRLKDAIETGRLHLHLQPKFTLDGKLVGAEALCRWQDERFGLVPPGDFVPLAEQFNLCTALDSWVLQTVCEMQARWCREGIPWLPIAVNLSASTFSSGRAHETVMAALERSGAPRGALEIEITESAVIRDEGQARESIAKIRAAGIELAMDDFGTGYSSLTHLLKFQIDAVKIDRSFVDNVDSSGEHRALCAGIVSLGKGLGVKTVAEGVETQAQLSTLAGLGCDEVQGFLLARPEPVDSYRVRLEDAGKRAG